MSHASNSNGNNQMFSLVRDITHFYIKHYYNDILKKKNATMLTESELKEFINVMYTDKQLDLKKYIRETLKAEMGDKYSIIATENMLIEMFKDPDFAKTRVFNEIWEYQTDFGEHNN